MNRKSVPNVKVLFSATKWLQMVGQEVRDGN